MLRETNKQLHKEKVHFKLENMCLHIHKFCNVKMLLMFCQAQLNDQNSQLIDQNSQLNDQNSQLIDQNSQLIDQNNQLKLELQEKTEKMVKEFAKNVSLIYTLLNILLCRRS